MSDRVPESPSEGNDRPHNENNEATPKGDHDGRRRRRPRLSKRGALVSLMAAVSVIALLVGLLAASGWPGRGSTDQAVSLTPREQQRTAAAARIASTDPSCDPPTGQSVQSAGEVDIDTAGGEGSVGLEFLKMLGEGAFTFGEEEGLGWLLSVIGGEQPSLDPAEIDQQFDQVNANLHALSQQESDDCQAVLATLAALRTDVDKDAYDNLAASMGQEIALVETYDQDYTKIVTDLGQNGGHVDALSSDDKKNMGEMLAGSKNGLRNIINTMNQLEAGAQPGADSMAKFFSKILIDELGYDPYQTHIFPAAFVNAATDQQGYYAAIVGQAVYLYSNVAHLDFTNGDYSHQSDPDGVASMVNLAQKDIQSWSVSFADGPTGDGTPNWVSQGKGQGIGPIPANTVLDYRVQKRPLLWTDAPVGLNGDPASPTPYYCGTTAPYCYADQYNSAGQVASTALVPSSPQPLADMIAAQDYDSLSGWRVPTSADWNALQAGAQGGLTAWGAAHQLGDIFAAQKVTSHYGGSDQSLTTIAPMLVNTGTSGSPLYGVLSSTDPAANALTLEKSDLGPLSQSGTAGRLFLTMDYQPTTPPKPFTDDTTAAAHPTGSTATLVSATRSPGPTTAVLTSADTPAPVTFSAPAACADDTTYTVPAGVGSVRITATGGAGAPGQVGNQNTAPGGVGGVVTETVPVTAGTTLYVQVGGSGSNGDSRRGGIAGGGTGGVSKSASPSSGDYSGGGGGASGVSTTSDCSHWLIVAGGGGGGGAGVNAAGHDPQRNGGRGGNGCVNVRDNACQAATDGSQLSGYTKSAGHAGGAAPDNRGGDTGRNPDGNPYGTQGGNGTTLQGGNGGTNNSSYIGGGGGGGGGGYYGGGGGGGSGWNAGGGGGGGGASFAIPVPGTTPAYGLGQAGQNGSVTIIPIAKPSLPISLTASPTHVAWDQPLPVTFTAAVPVDATGSLAFYVSGDDQPVGTAPIRHGIATLSTLRLAPMVGPHDVHVSYAGDAHYLATTSDDVPFVVTKQTPTMQLTVSGTVLKSGQAPTSLVVQMSPYAAGSVGFYNDINGGCDGKTGSGAVCQGEGVATVDLHGYATLTTLSVPLKPGKNYLHASYGGDSEYGANSEFNPADSNTVIVNVGS
jgi:Bacterial Ig-like domain (group 3)